MEPITLISRVSAKRTVFGTSVDDDLILFDPDSGAYYGAGNVGRAIWDLIKHERVVKSICDDLLKDFDVDKETCESEVIEFLGELLERGLVQTETDTNAAK